MSRSAVLLSVLFAGCSASGSDLVEAQVVGARVLDPGCVGSPYATIQSALNAAVSGDVVSICAGTYQERLTLVGKSISLVSRSGQRDVIVDAQTWGTGLAISGGANVSIDGFDFINGNSANIGGNVFCDTSTLTITNSRLATGNAGFGGGLGASNCTGDVTDTVVEGNAGWKGAGVWVSGTGFTIEGNSFLGNDASYSGGGVYVEGTNDILGNTFDGNTCVRYGGGAYVGESFGSVTDNIVQNNFSEDDGGGVYVQFGDTTVHGNTFTSNESGDEGGALRIKESPAIITDNVFTSNHADYRGGAMKISHEGVTLTGNTFTDNSTWVDAGAVLLFEAASSVVNNTFTGNTAARDGGAVQIVAGWDPVVMEDCTFTDNVASNNGGNVYIDLPGPTTILRRVKLDGGLAIRGGGLYVRNSSVIVENSSLSGNEATTAGGGIYTDAMTGRLTNLVLWHNESPSGAGLAVVSGGVLDVSNSVFGKSTGTAITLTSGTAPTLRYNDFNLNTANFSGIPNQLNLNGNKAFAPRFRSAATGDYRLLSTSQLINRGDPAVFDTNGSRSDIGRFGGPLAN